MLLGVMLILSGCSKANTGCEFTYDADLSHYNGMYVTGFQVKALATKVDLKDYTVILKSSSGEESFISSSDSINTAEVSNILPYTKYETIISNNTITFAEAEKII